MTDPVERARAVMAKGGVRAVLFESAVMPAALAVVKAACEAQDLLDATWLTMSTGDYDEPEIEKLVNALSA